MNCNQISAIVLAAGQSARLGAPKQLLPWQGGTLLDFTISTIHDSGIDDMVLVLGSNAELIKESLNKSTLRIVYNASWKSGKASSIRAGLNAISRAAEGVLIFLCDQPYLTAELIQKIVQTGEGSPAAIIAPAIGEQLINPVLFKKRTFSAFLTLQGEEGGKNLFSRYPLQRVEWGDARLLWDIDTPEDVQKLG